MSDREKALKGLEHCSEMNGENCSKCPYQNEQLGNAPTCTGHLAHDALALLKEQEARIRELEEELRALKYGDQDTLKSAMMPAT